VREPADFIGIQKGFHVRLGASAPDDLHVLSHDVEDGTSGDVVHRRLVSGKAPLTNAEAVFAAVPSKTEIGLLVDGAGDAYATARVVSTTTDGGVPLWKVVIRRKAAGGPFAPLPDVADGMRVDVAPDIGATSAARASDGSIGLLYHHAESTFWSAPRFVAFDGTAWSSPKTAESPPPQGIAGANPRLAIHGTRKYAAYFSRKSQPAETATAELRLATWSLSSEFPTVEVIAEGIPSPKPMDPRYRVAMAVDPHGLVHLVIAHPSNTLGGMLEYRRQTRVGDRVVWLRDIVDEDVISSDVAPAVDLVVDEDSRPHIAYVSAIDLGVRYATRFDR